MKRKLLLGTRSEFVAVAMVLCFIALCFMVNDLYLDHLMFKIDNS